VVAAVFLVSGTERVTTSSNAKLEGETVTDMAAPAAGNTSSVPSLTDAQRGAPPANTAARKVERSATLTLAVKPDDLQDAAASVGAAAEAHGGYVLDSRVSTDSGGSFTLRVPTRRLQSTLEDLSKLGKVTSRSENSRDLTAPFRGTQNRLGNALIELRALKLKLERTTDTAARDRIRVQIAQVRGEIRTLNANMEQLRRRTQMSTVNVTLKQSKDGGAVGGGGRGDGDSAWRDALDNLEAIGAFLLRAAGIVLPIALLAGLAALAGRALRRRRREGALA
jgi:hypothetical protein